MANTVFLTGLSGSGKTTLALQLLRVYEHPALYHLDGDILRRGLNSDLGFSIADREENIRRMVEVASIINSTGIDVIATFIMPLNSMRKMAKEKIPECKIVYINAPLEVCEQRDPKGLYKKARAGEIPQFTGIDSPFEDPGELADLDLWTNKYDIQQNARELHTWLYEWGF